MKIIELGSFRSKYSSDEYLKNAGVEDFLSLIYYADFVVTSSFHGTAFSILFNKQFISVAPSVRKTRLENITSIFEISDRLISENDLYMIDGLIKPINYEKINKLVNINADKARRFLKNALKFC